MKLTMSKYWLFGFLFFASTYVISCSFIQFPANTLLKPLAILCLLATVYLVNIKPLIKLLMAVALVCSLIGDIVLTLPINLQIELGIVFFVLVHLCYITLFIKNFQFNGSHLLFFLPFLMISSCYLFFLFPYLGDMKIPAICYFIIMMTMVFFAFQVRDYNSIIVAGALCFLFSDSILAFNVFVLPWLDRQVVIMVSYYMAQLLLTVGLIGIYQDKKV